MNVALVLLGVASVLVVLATSKSVTTSEIERREDSLLVAYREDEITYVKLERKGGDFVLERGEVDDAGLADWVIREPVDEEADVAEVQQFLDSLEFASWTRRITPEEVDRARFGLDDPKWVMRIRMGQIGYRLRLGKEAASPPGSAYLEVDGENVPKPGVGIVSKSLVAELEVGADTFRERLVMPYVSSALDRMVLEGRGGTRRLRAAPWGGWRFDGMRSDQRVNRGALDRVLLQFARTTADRFLEPANCARALEGAETVRVTMVPSGDRPKGVVEVGGRCPEGGADVVACRRSPDPVGACVPQSVMEGLSTTEDELVDRHLFDMQKDEVETFVIEVGEKKLDVARKDAGFFMRHPKEGDVDEDAGNRRLFDMISVRGRIVVDAKPREVGLEPPVGRVELTSAAAFDSEVRTETVLLGAPRADGSVYTKREHDGAILVVSKESARALTPDATLVRSASVLDFAPDQLRQVQIDSPGQRQVVERHASGTYTLHAPKGFDYDPGLTADLVDRLATLRAERWVADEDDGSFGLAKPRAVVTVQLARGDAATDSHVVTVGEATSGGAFAQKDGDSGVFVLPRALLDSLTTLLIDRGALVVEPAELSRLELTGRGRKIVIRRDGLGYSQEAGDTELTPGQVRSIVDALSVMRAEAALRVGAPRPVEGLAAPVLTVAVERVPGHAERSKPIRWRVGAGDSWRGISVFYARRDGVDATFVIARSKVLEVLHTL